MTTAQIIYEQYKILPTPIRQKLKSLINSEEETETPFSLLADIEQGLAEVKLIQAGKLPRRTFADLKRDMNNAE